MDGISLSQHDHHTHLQLVAVAATIYCSTIQPRRVIRTARCGEGEGGEWDGIKREVGEDEWGGVGWWGTKEWGGVRGKGWRKML